MPDHVYIKFFFIITCMAGNVCMSQTHKSNYFKSAKLLKEIDFKPKILFNDHDEFRKVNRFRVKKYDTQTLQTPYKKTSEQSIDQALKEMNENNKLPLFPTAITLSPDAQVGINVPILGHVVLKAQKSKIIGNQNRYAFTAEAPRFEKPLYIGLLTIEKGLFNLENGKLSYTAFINLFGARATVGLKEFSLQEEPVISKNRELKKNLELVRCVLGVTFLDDAASLTIAPGYTIAITDVDIILTQGKAIELRFSTQLFGQTIRYIALIDPITKDFSCKADLPKTPLIALVKELQGGPLENLFFEGDGAFDFYNGLILNGTVTSSKKNLEIAGITLNQARITIDMHKKHGIIIGDTDLLGLPLTLYCGFFFGDQKGIRLRAQVPSGVKNWQPFKTSSALPDVVRASTIYDLEAVAEASYRAVTDKKSSKKTDIVESLQKSDFIDLINSEDPDTKSQAIEQLFTDPEGIIIRDKGFNFACFIKGRSKILNVENQVILKLEKSDSYNISVTLVALLPKNWKLSQSFPEIFKPEGPLLCTTVDECLKLCTQSIHSCESIFKNYIMHAFDLITLNQARCIVATQKIEVDGNTINPGFSMAAQLSIDDTHNNPFLVLLKDFIQRVNNNSSQPTVDFFGSFNPAAPKSMAFKTALSAGGLGFNLGPMQLYGGVLNLVLRGEPSLGVEGLFKCKPTPKAEPIEFSCSAACTPIKFDCACSMVNTWVDPFGIKGFEFGNLGFRISQSYEAVGAALAAIATAGVSALDLLIPSDIGLSGDVRFGDKEGEGRGFEARARINLGKDITNFALVADIRDPLALTLLLEVILKQMGASTNLLKKIDALFPVRLKKAGIKFVPLGTTIGNIVVEQGIGGYCYIDIFGKEAHCDFQLGLNGLTAKGTVPQFKIGMLTMSSFDGKGDPALNIQFNEKEQLFFIDGLIKIANLLQSKTKWYITKEGTHFETETFVGPKNAQFGIKMKGTTLSFTDIQQWFGLKPEDIKLEIEFNDTLTETMRESITAELQRNKENFERDINNAIEQLGRDTILHDIKEQDRLVQEAKNRRIAFVEDPFKSIKRELEVVEAEIRAGLVRLKYDFEQSDFGKLFTQAARNIGLNKLTQDVLSIFKTLGIDVLTTGSAIVKDLSKLVIVRRVYWSGSLADLGKGILPGIQVELCAGCQLIKHKLGDFDILDPIKSIDTISKDAFLVINKVILATFKGDSCESLCGKG